MDQAFRVREGQPESEATSRKGLLRPTTKATTGTDARNETKESRLHQNRSEAVFTIRKDNYPPVTLLSPIHRCHKLSSCFVIEKPIRFRLEAHGMSAAPSWETQRRFNGASQGVGHYASVTQVSQKCHALSRASPRLRRLTYLSLNLKVAPSLALAPLAGQLRSSAIKYQARPCVTRLRNLFTRPDN
jgi:hypothetical protein